MEVHVESLSIAVVKGPFRLLPQSKSPPQGVLATVAGKYIAYLRATTFPCERL